MSSCQSYGSLKLTCRSFIFQVSLGSRFMQIPSIRQPRRCGLAVRPSRPNRPAGLPTSNRRLFPPISLPLAEIPFPQGSNLSLLLRVELLLQGHNQAVPRLEPSVLQQTCLVLRAPLRSYLGTLSTPPTMALFSTLEFSAEVSPPHNNGPGRRLARAQVSQTNEKAGGGVLVKVRRRRSHP